MEAVLVPLALFLLIFAVLYVYFTTRTKERLALTEKNLDAGVYNLDDSKYTVLKWGIFMVLLSIGIVGGYALSSIMNDVIAFFTSILLFGGIGLMLAYFATARLSKSDK